MKVSGSGVWLWSLTCVVAGGKVIAMYQATLLVYTDMQLHSKMPLIPLLRRFHLTITFPFTVLP